MTARQQRQQGITHKFRAALALGAIAALAVVAVYPARELTCDKEGWCEASFDWGRNGAHAAAAGLGGLAAAAAVLNRRKLLGGTQP